MTRLSTRTLATATALALVATPVVAGSATAHGKDHDAVAAPTTTTVRTARVALGDTPRITVAVKKATTTSKADAQRSHKKKHHRLAKVSGVVDVTVAGKTVTGKVRRGVARVRVPVDLAIGRHTVSAAFRGTARYAASTDEGALVVTKAKPRLRVGATLVQGAAPVVYAKVTSKADGAVTGDVRVVVRRGDFTTTATATLVDGRVKVTLPDALPVDPATTSHRGKRLAKAYKVKVTYLGSDTIRAKSVVKKVVAAPAATS